MPEDKRDAVVVGSGVGGLVCAAFLAVSGHRVLVVEQHDVAGGNAHAFRRRRAYQFDVGMHYVGDCGPDGVLPTILSGLGLAGRVRFEPMDQAGFDRVVLPSVTFDVPAGWDRYERRLAALLPGHAEGLARFCAIGRDLGAMLRASAFGGRPGDTPEEAVRWRNRSLADLFAHCGLPPLARTLLAAQAGNYGARPARTSVLTHVAMLDHYLRGAYFPAGGGQALVAALVEVIEAHGGEVRTRCRVEAIDIEGGRVRGIRLADGRTVPAATVVSNADYRRTVLDLCGGERHLPAGLVARTRGATMRMPLAVLYIGLDTALTGLPNANLWWHRYNDIEQEYDQLDRGELDEVPMAFLSLASVKEAHSGEVCPPGHGNLQVITMCPPEPARWGVDRGPADGGTYRRNAAYVANKERLTAAMLDAAETAIGRFRHRIRHVELATPLTHERYILSSAGTPYGLADWGGFARRPDTRTSVDGLYMVGQSTRYGSGITGSAVSGAACAAQIADRPFLAAAAGGAVFGDPALLPERPGDWDPLAVSRGLARRNAPGLARINRVDRLSTAASPASAR